MSTPMHDRRFPGESDAYRAARDELLKAEIALKDQREAVAALRRRLPLGAAIPTDYVFQEGSRDFRDTETVRGVRMSELLEGPRTTLVVIHYMFNPAREVPCPMCTMWADTYNAAAPHVLQRVNFVLVAKADIKRLRAWAAARKWDNLRLLSSLGTTFNRDYHAEEEDGGQNAGVSVFVKRNGAVHHSYSVEADAAHHGPGDPRHIDLLSPVWNLFDLTPEGRGDWYPSFSYG